ncbi:polysaccharide pyruvyl transferase family protein [Desulfosporosinus sp. SYSU MS00001]|uniref:polysaccharide pyruvyl transferase family protein n=1 Tax=Desulfosporosinus sp. SYSU MS00001 TaxID=3416284 RepID=UPI003CEBB694
MERDNPRKRIYIKAYIDRNLGDDLMICEFVEALGSDYELYLSCPADFQDYYHALLGDKVKLTELPLRKIHKFGLGFFALIVSLGGSTLIGRRMKGCYYRFINWLYLGVLSIFGTKFAIIGCNVGPFSSALTRAFVKLELRSAHIITCRDKPSYSFIKSAIAAKTHLWSFDDILADTASRHRITSNSVSDKSPLGVVVHCQMSEQATQKLMQTILQIHTDTGRGSVLFAFDSGIAQSDVVIANNIYKELRDAMPISVCIYEERWNVLREMAQCWKVIVVRFHGLVLALSLGLPFICIAYNNKHIDYLHSIGYNGKLFTLTEFVQTDVAEIVAAIETAKAELYVASHNSDQHFAKVHDFLEGRLPNV